MNDSIIDGYLKHKGRLQTKEKVNRAHKPYTHWKRIPFFAGREWIRICLLADLELYPGTASDKNFLLKRI